MNQLVLPVTPATLPSGSCPATNQELLNLFAQNLSVTFPDTFDGVLVSSTKPTDTTRAWLQLDSQGRPVRFYYFASGAWLSQHPCVPGFTMIWTTALPNFATFDGGDANAVSAISGPMWEVVLPAVFPLGAGTLPSGKIVAIGDTGGEENHTLTEKEMPPHTHPTNQIPLNVALGPLQVMCPPLTPGTNTGGFTGSDGGDSTLVPPASAPHNNLPQYAGVAFLRRTTRQFYAV